MPKDFSRTERVADALQRELAQLVRDELRDPRVGMLNITAVEVSRDLAHAKVFVNFVGENSEEETREGVAALNGAAGFLRTLLAKRMQLRVVPRLKFLFDASGERGQHLSALIDYAVSRDRAKNSEDE
jgi:ribosome-binding factor A